MLLAVSFLFSNSQAFDDYELIGIVAANNQDLEQDLSNDANDPFEKTNRKIFKFNEKIDKKIVKPIAKGYRKVIPSPARKSIRNVLNHIDDLFVIGNDALQAKPKQTLKDTARFLFNSTFGVLGLFDVATHMGLPKNDEDFGQTLGKWGVKPGPYFVTPFLGPSTVRSFAGDITHAVAANNATVEGKYVLGPAKNFGRNGERYSYRVIEVIDKRESLLDAEDILDTFVVDKYTAVRDAYLQNREYLINDGNLEDSDIEATDKTEIGDKPTNDTQIAKVAKPEAQAKPKNIDKSLEDSIADDEDLL